MTTSLPAREQSLRDLLIFHDVARALTSSLDLDSILRVIMKQMEPFFQPESWSLLILDEKKKDLYFAVIAGLPTQGLADARVPLGEGIAGWVAEHGETLIVPRVELDSRFSSKGPRGPAPGLALGVHSAICLPLRSRMKTLGVIQLFNCPLDALTDYMISFLHLLCDYAAIAIENAHAVQKIQDLTITDDCTNLYNVRHLYQRLDEEIERSRRFSTPLSLIFIDLDHFKLINDEHGHLIGSRLLQSVGEQIVSLVRSIDMTFRYGGDEFVILLPSTGPGQATEIAHRLRDALRSGSFQLAPGLRITIRASFGVATYPDCGRTSHEIIGHADKAMYRIKNSTRDGVAGPAID